MNSKVQSRLSGSLSEYSGLVYASAPTLNCSEPVRKIEPLIVNLGRHTPRVVLEQGSRARRDYKFFPF